MGACLAQVGLRRGKVVAVTGFRNQVSAFLPRIFPRAMVRKVTKRLNNVSYD